MLDNNQPWRHCKITNSVIQEINIGKLLTTTMKMM